MMKRINSLFMDVKEQMNVIGLLLMIFKLDVLYWSLEFLAIERLEMALLLLKTGYEEKV